MSYNNDHITEAYQATADDAAIAGMQELLNDYPEDVQVAAQENAWRTIKELGLEDNDYNFYYYALRTVQQ